MQTASNGTPAGSHRRVNGDDGVLIVPGHDRVGMHQMSEPSAGSRSSSVLTLKAALAAFRRRWFTALSLGLIVGIAAAAVVWFVVPARYTAFAELQVKEVAEKILFETADKQSAFRTYKQTQMRMVTSPFVLSSALRKPELSNLKMLEQTGDPVHWLETKIEVTSPASEFVRISLAGDEPKELAAVINAVTEAYMEEVVNSEKLKRQKRKDNLEQVHREFDETLRTRRVAVKKLAEALQTSDSAALTIKQQMAAEYFAQLRREHAQTRFERMRAETQLAAGSGEPTSASDVTIPEALLEAKLDQEPEVLKLNDRVLTLEELIRKTRQTVTNDDHPLLGQYRKELDDVKAQIQDVRAKIRPRIITQIQSSATAVAESDVHQLKKRVEVLKAQETQLEEELELQQSQQKQLGVSSFELESLKKEIEQIETMDKRITEEIQRLGIELQSPSRVLLHRPAEIPKLPAIEQKYKLTGVAGIGLFLLVCGGIVWIDMSARKINTADDVIGTLHVPILGYLPELPRSFKHNNDNSSNGRFLSVQNHWMESVDSTRAILLHDADQRSMNVVMVTSAISGEGKSTLSSQLACSLARSGRTTLLVDADVRSPSLHTMFDVPLSPGLSELLRGEVEDHDVIQRTQHDGLFIVTAGQISEETLRCMARERTQPIFARFKTEFSFVVVDSPPVLLVVDALLIGKHVDAAILAVRRDLSRSTRTAAACQRLTAVGIPVLGSIVIGVDQSSSKYGGYYGYGYGYGYGSRSANQEVDEART
ncbi:MAG: polysaccharide biosynthesis tyrosine autokinase [Planctomycetaceae bacterium]